MESGSPNRRKINLISRNEEKSNRCTYSDMLAEILGRKEESVELNIKEEDKDPAHGGLTHIIKNSTQKEILEFLRTIFSEGGLFGATKDQLKRIIHIINVIYNV